MLSLISTLLVVGNTAVTAWAADLTKIDRTIATEPAYTSKPKYCLLVFGPKANTRVWLVLDGDVLYADRNGNGNLTEKGERFVPARKEWGLVWEIGDVAAPGGRAVYTGLRVCDRSKSRGTSAFAPGLGITVNVPIGKTRVPQSAGTLVYYHRYRLDFAARPNDAPVIHFGGPLAMMLLKPERLSAGMKAGVTYDLEARVGTPGLGKDTTATIDDDVSLGGDSDARSAAAVGELQFTDRQGRTQRLRERLAYD
jgi:hypothetical protein